MKVLELKEKLLQIRDLVDNCLESLTGSIPPLSSSDGAQSQGKTFSSKDYILNIVNKIKNCEEADRIDEAILEKNSVPGRILLPFFICYKYFPELGLTSGDIEKITNQLRVRIKTPNVSNALSNSLSKYLDGDATRVKGKAVTYRLNRKGAKHFKSLLNLDEKK